MLTELKYCEDEYEKRSVILYNTDQKISLFKCVREMMHKFGLKNSVTRHEFPSRIEFFEQHGKWLENIFDEYKSVLSILRKKDFKGSQETSAKKYKGFIDTVFKKWTGSSFKLGRKKGGDSVIIFEPNKKLLKIFNSIVTKINNDNLSCNL